MASAAIDLGATSGRVVIGEYTGDRKAAASGETIESIGVDTWGVDFVLLGRDGHFLAQPRSYRDSYTVGMPEKFFGIIPYEMPSSAALADAQMDELKVAFNL